MALTKFEVLVGTNTYNLSDRNEFMILGDEGFGMAPVTRKSVKGPSQDGEIDVGFNLESRILAVTIGAFSSSEEDYYQRRARLLRVFAPRLEPFIVRKTLPDGSIRQIDCHYAGQLTFPSRLHRGHMQQDAVALQAPNPTFYEPVPLTIEGAVSSAGALEFPISFPISFASSVLNEGINIYYSGSWKSYPTITLTGPMQNPVITNTTLGLKIELEHDLIAAEVVTIELTPGSKQIYDNGTPPLNLIGTVSDDSDLSEFHIASSPDGDISYVNAITLLAGGMTPGTSKIELEYYRRYVGL